METATRQLACTLLVLFAVGCEITDDDDGFSVDEDPITNDGGVTCVGPDAGLDFGDAGLDGGGTDQGDLSDGQTAAVLLTANMGEVEQGLLAIARATREDVRAFAARMVLDHSNAVSMQAELQRTLELPLEQTATSLALRTKSENTVTALASAEPGDFDLRYVTAQVDNHQSLLSMLDERLIPGADDEAWKAALVAKRATVASHLEHAQRLEATLGADGGAGGDGGTDGGADGGSNGGDAGADAGQDGDAGGAGG